ncbi:MAG: hypothetical protein BWY64_00982 [bacterium ADurb.Bin363]|nr:MAG: hypothetical protein BWY64_00982 [bacterium ADurb.Bin363]
MNAIGLIELNSMARGIEVWDTMLKVASVELLTATTLCSGKYVIFIKGDVGSVKTSIEIGLEVAGIWLIDSLIIPNIHHQVFHAITGETDFDIEALGIIETFSAASGIVFADTAVKSSAVNLIEIRISMGLGGKSTIYLTGEVDAVKASIEAGKGAIKSELIVNTIVIPSPHKDLIKHLKEE